MLKNHKYLFIFLIFLMSVLAQAPVLAEQQNSFFSTLEAELLGGYSKIPGREGEFSSLDRWLFSPSWKLNDRLYWINIYNGSFNRSAQVVAQEEGGRQTNTTQSHNLSTSLKYYISESWSLRPTFSSSWIFVNETEDEDFGDGLYDYEELSGGIESGWTTLKTKNEKKEWRLGFNYTNREYPNYRSLISQIGGTVETNEKDLDGYKVNLAHESQNKIGWSWGLEGIFFYKDYTDKKTINQNGVLSRDETREDYTEYINAHAYHALSPGWTFRLDGQFAVNQSNLDFYDTHNTLATLADDDFVKNYFDYYSFLVKPTIVYSKELAQDRLFLASLDYTFYALHYTGRKTQNTAGRYQADDQQDYTHTFSAKTNVSLTKNISWVVLGSYTIADSNQDFETFYLYNYDLWSAVTGISLKY